MTSAPRIRIRTRMSGRDIDEENRVSSSLELLFDLTFVVAVAQIALQLARTISAGTALTDGLGPYLMVFFAIWWAWLNFTWFASAYDTDDLPYRLTTMVQMAGVLVLAAGVQSAFDKQQYFGITLGYFIMRVPSPSCSSVGSPGCCCPPSSER
jgi:low temperature requirement protein LtrA